MLVAWDDSDEESIDEEQSHEVSNLAFMAIGDESFDEVNDLHSYNGLVES